MSSAIYEKLGRAVAAKWVATAEFAAKKPAAGAKKKNCKDTSHSCGFTCISGQKVCRITMTLEQQKVAKQLKKDLRASAKKSTEEVSTLKPAKEPAGKIDERKKLEAENIRQQQEYLKKGGVKVDLLPVLKVLSPQGTARMSISYGATPGIVSYGGAFVSSDGNGNISVRKKQNTTQKEHTETHRAIKQAATALNPKSKVTKTY